MDQIFMPSSPTSICLEAPQAQNDIPIVYLTINSDTPFSYAAEKPESNIAKYMGQLSQIKPEPQNSQNNHIDQDK